jgi:signal transduction histidine kinase
MAGRRPDAYAAGMSTAEEPAGTQAGGRARGRRRPWWLGDLGQPQPRDRAAGWRRWQPASRDAMFAASITLLTLVGAVGEAHPRQPIDKVGVPPTPDAAFLLVAVAGLALAWRLRYPLQVLCVSMAAVVAFTLLGYVNGAALILPAAALWAAASVMPISKSAAWAVASTAILMGTTALASPFGPTGGGFVLIPANMAVGLFGGIAVRNRRAYVSSLRENAARDARRLLDEERLRIARELHDVVAHTMATINVQASAAARVLASRPEQAAESLAAIRAASKDGLRELRAILNVLRQADEAADPTQPAPGLARLDALATGVSQAGVPVTVTVTGQPRPVPAVADLAAFRIIQEALTNTIRHAGPATATVTLCYAGTELRIEVTDTGRGPGRGTAPRTGPAADGGSGHGLRGMRERAAAAGGEVEAGRAPSGGFRVAVRLPLQPGPGAAGTLIAPVAAGEGGRR